MNSVKKDIKIFLTVMLLLASNLYSQSQLVMCVPDTGTQQRNYSFLLYGTGTQWLVSPYFEIYFWGGGMYADSVHAVNDSLIRAHIYIDGKADSGYRTVILSDAFLNSDSIPRGFKVFLNFPVAPTLFYPMNNSINIPYDINILWDSNKSVSVFQFQISQDSTFSSQVFDTLVAQPPVKMRLGILQMNQKYYWRVRGINIIGTGPWSDVWNFRVRSTGIENISSEIPANFELRQNYPNPFNPLTTINYAIARAGNAKLILYDVTGKIVSVLFEQYHQPGYYKFNFAAMNLSSGIYFYSLMTNDISLTKKMVILK